MKTGLKIVASGLLLSALCVLFVPSEGIGKEGYVGTKGCVICHPIQKKAYEAHDHADDTGKWVEEGQAKGIGCESCHGAGQAHVDIGAKDLKKLKKKKGDLKILGRKDNKKGELCIACHRLTDNDNIELATDMLIKYGQEHSELARSKKAQFKMTCGSCHDPHETAAEQKGIKRKCLDCHKGKFKIEIKIPAMVDLTCEACHMPPVVTKGTGTKVGEFYKGEYSSHVFGISVDPDYALNDGTNHMSLTDKGLARLTVENTCYACHKTGGAPDMSREKFLKAGAKIHK